MQNELPKKSEVLERKKKKAGKELSVTMWDSGHCVGKLI